MDRKDAINQIYSAPVTAYQWKCPSCGKVLICLNRRQLESYITHHLMVHSHPQQQAHQQKGSGEVKLYPGKIGRSPTVPREQVQPVKPPNIGPDGFSFRIVNIVSTLNFNTRIDLTEITSKFTGVAYNPSNFPGLVFRIKQFEASILIFKTGRAVCSGTRSMEQLDNAVSELYNRLTVAGINVGKPNTKVQNVVITGNIGKILFVEEASQLLDKILYDPEIFPGLIYMDPDNHCSLLLFSSGNYVCAGTREVQNAYNSVKHVRTRLLDMGLIKEWD